MRKKLLWQYLWGENMMNNDHTGFTVRRAEKTDIADIAKITHEAFLKYAELAGLDTIEALTETYDDIESDIKNKLVLVAFIDGKVVGSVRVAVNGDEGYLYRFGVSLDRQNLGIGKSLMNMVDIEMESLGVKTLSLHTGAKIASLVKFYYSRGFYIDSTSKDKGYVRALLIKNYN